MLVLALLAGFDAALASHACKDVKLNDPAVPECPASGVLGERFPPLAMVISDNGGGSDYHAVETVLEVLGTEKKPPLLVLNVTDNTYRAIQSLIPTIAKKDPKKAAAMKGALRRISGPAYGWTQDFMQSHSRLNDGRPEIREVLNYRKAQHIKADPPPGSPPRANKSPSHAPEPTQKLFASIAGVLAKECGVGTGKGLGETNNGRAGGHAGGNIEAGPGDLCVIGDDQLARVGANEFEKYATDACRNLDNVVRAPTSWLQVGHADEITTTIKTGSGPCDFAVLVASPKAARKSLSERGTEPVWSFPSRFETKEQKIELLNATPAMAMICQKHLHRRESSPPRDRPGHRAFLDRVMDLFVGRGRAEIHIAARDYTPCLEMTNNDLLAVLKENPALDEYNTLVERRLAEFSTEYAEKVKKNLPQCGEVGEKFHPVPALFVGEPGKEKRESVLPSAFGDPNSGYAVFPNLTNGVALESAYYSPDPMNTALKKSLEGLLNDKLKMKTQFLDTSVQHARGGNLHCITNVVRYCRPRTGK